MAKFISSDSLSLPIGSVFEDAEDTVGEELGNWTGHASETLHKEVDRLAPE